MAEYAPAGHPRSMPKALKVMLIILALSLLLPVLFPHPAVLLFVYFLWFAFVCLLVAWP